MSANSFEELRNRMVAILTTIANTPSGSGITAITSIDGSISIDNTDPSAPDLSMPSGLFAPTISNIINDAIVQNIEGIYSRSGGVVTGMFQCDVTLDAGANSASFEFSLPILTDFANRNQLHCTCNVITNLVELVGEAVISDSKGTVSITSANNGDQLQLLTINYKYLIV